MANTIMASCKPLISVSSSSSRPTNRVPKLQLQVQLPKITKTQLQSLSSSTLKFLSLAVSTSIAFAPPALAAEIGKAALFDFDLNLPIMMAKFLVLMFNLDGLITLVENLFDKLEAVLMEKLAEEEVNQRFIRDWAERSERLLALRKMNKETMEEVDRLLKEGKTIVDAELKEAVANMERQKEETIELCWSQIAALRDVFV